MEIVTEKMDVKINGVAYELEFPTYERVEEMTGELDKLMKVQGSDSEGISVLKFKGDFLTNSGMPVDVLKKLQMKHVNEIFEVLLGAKKD